MNWQTAQTRLESLTTEAIWQYSDRTLTSGNGPGLDDIADAVKAAVWNYAFTGGEAAGTTGHTLHMTGDITAIAVWEYTTRSLSSPPPSAAAIRQEIDGNSTQFASIDARLTSLEETVAVIPTDTTSAVWGAETRTLSSYGTLVADTAAASATSVWAAATRSLTDKSGFAPTAVAIRQEIDANSTTIATIDGVVDRDRPSALTSLATDVPSAEEIRQEIDANSSMLSTIDLKVDSTQGSLDSLDARIPAALQGGRMQSYVGAMAGGVVSASTLATGTITTAKFAAGAIDAAAVGSDTLTAIAAALLSLANGIETGVTLKQALQRIGAVVAGKSSGAGTGVESFTGLDGSTPRVTINVASDGNQGRGHLLMKQSMLGFTFRRAGPSGLFPGRPGAAAEGMACRRSAPCVGLVGPRRSTSAAPTFPRAASTPRIRPLRREFHATIAADLPRCHRPPDRVRRRPVALRRAAGHPPGDPRGAA